MTMCGGGGGGGAKKKEKFWGISCEKSRFTPKKNLIFSNFREGAGCAWIRPCYV